MEDAAVQPQIWTPIFQFGFAGFAAVLLAILVWLIRRLLDVLDANTEAIQGMSKTTSDEMRLMRDLYNKIISRPCIAKHEQDP